MRKTVKFSAYTLAGLTLLMGLLILVAVGLSNTDLARRTVLERINATLNGRLTLTDHHLALFGGRFELRDLALKSPGGETLIALDRFLLDWRWRDLLGRTLHLSEVALEAPRGRLSIGADGRLNLLDLFPSAAEARPDPDPDPDALAGELPINIFIAEFRVQGGRLDFEHRPSGAHLRLADLGAFATADLKERKGRLDLELAGLTIETPQVDTRIAALDLKTVFDGDTLILNGLSLATENGQTRLDAHGRADQLGAASRLEFKLALESELAQWSTLLPTDRPLSGPLKVNLAVSGRLDDPTARLTATYGGGRLAGAALRAAALDLGLEGRQLTLTELKLQPTGGELTLQAEADLRPVWPEGFLSASPRLDQLTYRLDLAASRVPLNMLARMPEGYGGLLGAALHLEGRGIAPQTAEAEGADSLSSAHADLSGTLTLSEGRIPVEGTPTTATLATVARLSKGRLDVAQLDLTAPEATLSAHGQVDLAAARVAAEVRLQADDLSHLQTLAGLERLAGQVAGQFSVKGQLARPEVHFDLNGRQLAAEQVTIGDLALAGDLSSQGELEVAHLNLVNQGSRIDAQGRLKLPMGKGDSLDALPIEATLRLQRVTAADFTTADLAQGHLDGSIVLGGTLRRPRAEVALTGQGVSVAAVTLGDLAVDARIAAGMARIHQLTLRNGSSYIKVNGEAGLYDADALTPLEDPHFNLELDAPVLDIGDFYAQAQGRLSLKGRLQGRRSGPTGELHIDGRDLKAAGQAISQLSVDLNFRDQRLTLETLTLALAEDARIDGRGWVDTGGRYEMTLNSQAIPLARIAALEAQEVVAGIISFDIDGSGRLDDPGLDGDIRLTQMRLNQEPIDDGHLRLAVAGGQARLTGGLNFDLAASYRWADQSYEAALDFDGTELALYLAAFGQTDLAGRLDGRIRARGDLVHPENLSAEIDLSGVSLAYKGQPLLATQALKADFADQTLRLSPTRLRLLEDGELSADGQVGLDKRIDFRLNGQVPLAVARPFIGEGSDLRGRADLQLAVTGNFEAPRIDARVALDQVGMTVPVTYQKLHRLSGEIRFDGKQVEIRDLGGQLDDGRFALGGRAEIDGGRLRQADLSLKAHALPLALPDMLDLKLDIDLRLEGSMAAARLHGDVMLLEGLYYKDVNLNLFKAATTRRRAQAPPVAVEPDPKLEAIALDISIGRRQPFFVANNLADLQLAPDLQVGGTLAQPVLSGRAQVIEGELTYQGKTFAITRGVIDFVDPYRIAPEVEVVSETRVRDWQITLDVSGTPDALLFKLTSDPSEEDNDIISLLLLGRTSKELIEGEGGSSQSTKQMLANLVASTMGEDLKRVAGVDILEVDTTNDEDDPEGERIEVTVGKKISRRLTLKYALESKAGLFTRRVISEYKIIDEMMATGFQDSDGIFGGELLFRLEFR